MNAINERLWIEKGDGAAVAHRCVLAGSGKPTLHQFEGRRQRCLCIRIIGGDGSLLAAPVNDVVPAAPLSAAEEAEYQRLDLKLSRSPRGDAGDLRRFNSLRLRWLMFGGVPIDSVQAPA